MSIEVQQRLFEVDRKAHTYTLDGQRLPSVTDILGLLQNFDSIPWAVLENARQRGERLHRAINLFNRDALDLDQVDDLTRAGVDAWARFLDQSGAIVIASEQPVVHAALGYAGTPDVVLDWRGRIAIPDIKATFAIPPTVGSQTWAYAAAWHEMNGKRGALPQRYVAHIKGGECKLQKCDDPADQSLFISCLNVWKWLDRAAA